jgi:hypothetical protein
MSTLPEPDFERNDPTHDTTYTGEVYAFGASGGLSM